MELTLPEQVYEAWGSPEPVEIGLPKRGGSVYQYRLRDVVQVTPEGIRIPAEVTVTVRQSPEGVWHDSYETAPARPAEKTPGGTGSSNFDEPRLSRELKEWLQKERYKILDTQSAAQANAEWREIGYDKSPIAAGTEVYHISAGDHAYVQVYRRAAGNYAGRWIMRAEDIAGLTGAEIAEKYALPVIPDMICDVKLPPELELEVSIAGEQKQWRRSHGGNVQYGIKSTRPKDVWFTNRRRLNE